MHLAAPGDPRDDAGHLAALDMAGHDVVQAAEPPPGQRPGGYPNGAVSTGGLEH
jgi:hypothetical protein